jgi:hypothetical protein
MSKTSGSMRSEQYPKTPSGRALTSDLLGFGLVLFTLLLARARPIRSEELVELEVEQPVGQLVDADEAIDGGMQFLRGDANGDGRLSLADVFTTLRWIHLGIPVPCLDAADTDDSGTVTPTDFAYLLGSIFWRHSPPPRPYPSIGIDPTPDALDCGEGPRIARAPLGNADEIPGLDCFPDEGGVDTEFILFRHKHLFAFPGQTGLRVPIQLSALDDIEGLTMSLRAQPASLDFKRVDFTATIAKFSRGWRPFVHTYLGQADQGYIAATIILDMGVPGAGLDGLFYETIAHLEFSVPESLPVGTRIEVTFQETPGRDGSPPIGNELIHRGKSLRSTTCGFDVLIVHREEIFVRGDVDRDGEIQISDPVALLRFLFDDRVTFLACPDAADVNDDGHVQVTDALRLLRFLFLGGSAPLPPFEVPGTDIAQGDSLRCENLPQDP